jgi:hypothetical protein
MTVQQHAPSLVRFGPTVAIPTSVLVAIGIVIVAVAAVIGTWLLMQPTAISPGELEALRKLEQLREMIPGGFI